MRLLQLAPILLAAGVLVGTSARLVAQQPQADADSIPRARLLELLRSAPPAPIPPGAQVGTLEESASPARRQTIGVDLATGVQVVAALPDTAVDAQPVSSPPQPPQYPMGIENSPSARREHRDGVPGPIVSVAATPPSPLVNTLSHPWNTVFKLLMRFNVAGSDYFYVCSASSLGSFHLLSAGHCIYNHDPNDDGSTSDAGWANQVWAWAAQTDQVNPFADPDHPYGTAQATFLRSYTGWTSSQDYNHDWAVITLDRRVGDRTGWMGRETNATTNSLNFSGYPSETPYVPAGTPFQYPGFDTGNVRSYTTNRINLDAFTYGGHSGGPAWRFDGTNQWIQGINSTSNRAGSAGETRLSNEKFTDIDSYIAADGTARPPTARADLIEYLFSGTAKDVLTNVVGAGGTATIEYNVLNAGHATAANVQVDFRLSVDPIISTADTLIGTLSLGSLEPNVFFNPIATLSIPANLPPGSYYVGWIMRTSSSEYTTGDNSVVIANELLTVVIAPDLRTIAPGVSTSLLLTSESFAVSATVQNQGSGASSATTLRYYLSNDSIITTADTQVGTDAVAALIAGATAAVSEVVTAPLLPGSYWIGACVDAVGGELATTNQCSAGVAITVAGRPDLRTVTPGVSKLILMNGESVVVSATVQNLGGVTSAATTLRYYVSPDSIISTADTQIGTDAVAAIGAGAASLQSETVIAPPIAGVYWIGGCVDVVAQENVTVNQCSTGIAVRITYFTDDPLTAGSSVKAIHFQEMRDRVNVLRSSRGLPVAIWTDLSLTPFVTGIRAIHLQQIRLALADVYVVDGIPAPAYTNAPIAPGDPIRAIDITETRAAIMARP